MRCARISFLQCAGVLPCVLASFWVKQNYPDPAHKDKVGKQQSAPSNSNTNKHILSLYLHTCIIYISQKNGKFQDCSISFKYKSARVIRSLTGYFCWINFNWKWTPWISGLISTFSNQHIDTRIISMSQPKQIFFLTFVSIGRLMERILCFFPTSLFYKTLFHSALFNSWKSKASWPKRIRSRGFFKEEFC